MKPAPFLYFAPTSLDEALDLVAQHGYDGKILAGGQSLIPTMNFRLAQPSALIDLNNLADLSYIQANESGGLRIGAMTRQRTVERNELVEERAPLIHQTMPYIAHVQIRNRGTFGGSIAHADPAAELPAVAVALGARLRIRSQAGERWVNAEDFFVGLFTTDLAPDEILLEVEIPALPARSGFAIQEVARRHGDYALVGVAATITLDEQGKCSAAMIALLSVGEGPVLAKKATQMLIGERPTSALLIEVAEVTGAVDIDPNSDIHASAEFRRHLAKVLTRRVLLQASQRVAVIE